MLNLFQHLLICSRLSSASSALLRLRVKPEGFAEGNPAMTGALIMGFLEVPFLYRKINLRISKKGYNFAVGMQICIFYG